MKITFIPKRSGITIRYLQALVMLFFLISVSLYSQEQKVAPVSAISEGQGSSKWVIVIHGGAGGITRENTDQKHEMAYRTSLEEALKLGSSILSGGGSSLDAVEAVVKLMEDCGTFNAGKGAVLNEAGKAELDAAIMDGNTGMAGAVAGVSVIKNPVAAARKVMADGKHVMMVGAGAENFAMKNKVEVVEPGYFITEEKINALEKSKSPAPARPADEKQEKEKHGTVGAVALDLRGNLAAATSTGGIMGKRSGRVGDSPIIGAGTYANNKTCAVSATGRGEFFIRSVAAYDVSAMMQYLNMPLENAARAVIFEKIASMKGEGGLIAVDKDGNISMPYNTASMIRGYMSSTGERMMEIY
jgi:L-asparaginase / beta-aspartyl-peptidase